MTPKKVIKRKSRDVAEALEWSGGEFSPDPPQELVHLDFPLLDHNTMLTARVVFWQPAREDWSGGDIAGLQLMSDAPVGAEAVRFALAEDVWDHDFRVFGFPRGQDNGVWATGRLLDRQASNWIQIEDNKTGGFSVIPGFSGGAVWDEQLEGVVGMVVASIVQPEILAPHPTRQRVGSASKYNHYQESIFGYRNFCHSSRKECLT